MAVGTWIGAWALARIAMPVVAELRTEVVDSALTLDSQRIERTGTGDLVSRVADDSRKIGEAAGQVLPLVVESLLVVVVSAFGLAAIDWRLGLTGLVAIPMYWLTLRWYLPDQNRSENARRSGGVPALLGGLTAVRRFAPIVPRPEMRRIDSASARPRPVHRRLRFVTRAFGRNTAPRQSSTAPHAGSPRLVRRVHRQAVTTAALVFHRLFNPIGSSSHSSTRSSPPAHPDPHGRRHRSRTAPSRPTRTHPPPRGSCSRPVVLLSPTGYGQPGAARCEPEHRTR